MKTQKIILHAVFSFCTLFCILMVYFNYSAASENFFLLDIQSVGNFDSQSYQLLGQYNFAINEGEFDSQIVFKDTITANHFIVLVSVDYMDDYFSSSPDIMLSLTYLDQEIVCEKEAYLSNGAAIKILTKPGGSVSATVQNAVIPGIWGTIQVFIPQTNNPEAN